MDDASLKRAGLDYWQNVELKQHTTWEAFQDFAAGRILLFSKFGQKNYSDEEYKADDWLVFGNETSGLPDSIHTWAAETGNPMLRIPVMERCRSLNLANSVAVVIFESLRQRGFPGCLKQGPGYTT